MPLPNVDEIITEIAKIRVRMLDTEMIELKSQNAIGHKIAMESEFSAFSDRYPTLFKMVYNGENIDRLAEYLDMIEKIKAGKITQTDGEKVLGERLAETYLKNTITK